MNSKEFTISNEVVQILGTIAEGTHQDANNVLRTALGLYVNALRGKAEGKRMGLYEKTPEGEDVVTTSFNVHGDWSGIEQAFGEAPSETPRRAAHSQ